MTDHECTPQTGEVHNTIAEMRELLVLRWGWGEGLRFDEALAAHDAEVRADEREKAVQQVRAEALSWRHNCGGPDLCLICLYANSAIAAARGEGF